MGKEKMKKYKAVFSCGHKGYISFFTKNDLYINLAKAEKKGLCPACKEKELKQKNQFFAMPYSDYKKLFAKKRGVITGKYNEKSHTIDVWLPPKLAKEYVEEKEKVWYDANIINDLKDGSYEINLFIEGNSYKIKDSLKKLGFKWENKQWCIELVVFPEYIENTSRRWLPPNNNPEFYSLCQELDNIGCVSNLVSLDWDD